MQLTVFCTPVITPLLRWLSLLLLWALRWRVEGELPAQRKLVLIGAPHTSNWDFPLMLLAVLSQRLQVHWMGKHTLFPWGLGWFMRWLGGIAIDRRQANNTVDQIVDHYRHNPSLVVLIPPEGTRAKVQRWKSGFYHIAQGAEVPILLGYIDCATRTVGFGPLFQPTGNWEWDLPAIQAFYRDKRGIRPEHGID